MMPFEEDCTACAIARAAGLELRRRERVEIVDEAAIFRAGLTATMPDWTRIRRALENGIPIAGARLAGVEYVLRPRPATPEDHEQ